MRRGKEAPEELRERAEALIAAAPERARAELVKGDAEAEKLYLRADKLEFDQRAAEQRCALTREAAEAAQAGLEARDAGGAATAEAVGQAALKAELAVKLGQLEAERSRRLELIERLTADGRPDEARDLEQGLGEVDPEPLRERAALVSAAERAARDRAAGREALAEQKRAESAELRSRLERVEQELEPEFAERRRARALEAAARLVMFDQRAKSLSIAVQAEAKLIGEEARKSRVDSASQPQPSGQTIELTADGRFVGVAGLIPR